MGYTRVTAHILSVIDMSLSYDSSLLRSVRFGIEDQDVTSNTQAFEEAVRVVQEQKKNGELGFAKLPYAAEEVEKVERLASELLGEGFESVILIGIGGTDLGARAAHRALRHQYYNVSAAARNGHPQLFFAGDTTDPESLQEVMDVVDLKKTLVVMVSKSGNTIEQMATFITVRKHLIDAVGEEQAKRQIVTVTDAHEGTLRAITENEGYRSLAVPSDVGGRFSVLSCVGLFPLALTGVDIRALVKGAQDLDAEDRDTKSLAARFAFDQYLAFVVRRQTISVMFPYSYCLRETGLWFRQLWAESLGKEGTGPTPVAAIGPTDQHSQVQLYMDGPADKIFTFVVAKETSRDITLPGAFEDLEGVRYLKGISMYRILRAEQEATAAALGEKGRPSVCIEIDKVDPYHMGQLFYFFELATAYAGALFKVNAYDQPGVELGKQILFKKLGRN